MLDRPKIAFPGLIKGQKPLRLAHDFETYCDENVTDIGADAYSRHPSCEVLMCAFAINDAPVEQWSTAEGQRMPAKLEDAMLDERVIKTCWNKGFEWSIWKNVLGYTIPHEQWRDTQALAYSLALPGSLEKAGEVVEIAEDKKKSAEGRALMRVFSTPRKPTKTKPHTRTHWWMEPEKWDRYLAYNRNDVEAERAILKKLRVFDMPEHEWELWVIDQIINERGIPINMEAVNAAITLYEHLIENRVSRLKAITGLANPNSTQQLLPWLQDHGYQFEDLKKGHVQRAVETGQQEIEAAPADSKSVPDTKKMIEALELRQDTARASPKKYYAIRRCVDKIECVLRNTFQFAGAGRTWRWAGRTFQPQNLPRPEKAYKKIIVMVVEHLEKLDPEAIELVYEDPMKLLVSCIRSVAQAPDGHLFFDADLNAIENRVLGFIALCRKILKVFEAGRDPYIDFATYLYHQTYDDLYAEYKAGDDSKRTIAKPAVLGCFGSDTPVLTNHGWKRIVDVACDDLVHDGREFVRHDGVAYRGEKELLCGSGVYATEDHLVRTGDLEWRPWRDLLVANKTFQLARDTASGQLKHSLALGRLRAKSFGVGALADLFATSRAEILCMESQLDALAARPAHVEARSENELVQRFMTYSQIVSMLRASGAKTPQVSILTTTAGEEFVCGSLTPPRGSHTALTSSEPTANSKSTEKTTTVTTSREISGSLHDPSKTTTSGPSWDIVNAGTRQSFVILTESGPLVVHNCGYQLGPGEEHLNHKTGEMEATGLLGYARNMFIILTPQQAKDSVAVFRETYTEVVDFWAALGKAAIKCVRTGKPTKCNMIRFDIKAPFLRMILPSGRALHYCRPRIEPVKTPWGEWRDSLTYEGLNDKNQWVRIPTHGGKLTENADQAMARDILAGGMRRAYYRGLDICIHVHDQIVGCAPISVAEHHLEILQECMAEEEDWYTYGNYKLPISSNGFVSKVFMKD